MQVSNRSENLRPRVRCVFGCVLFVRAALSGACALLGLRKHRGDLAWILALENPSHWADAPWVVSLEVRKTEMVS